jgi:hypothetical protein
MYVCMYVHTYVCVCVYIYHNTHIMYTICVHVLNVLYDTCREIFEKLCLDTHTHLRTHTHTHTHTHTQYTYILFVARHTSEATQLLTKLLTKLLTNYELNNDLIY